MTARIVDWRITWPVWQPIEHLDEGQVTEQSANSGVRSSQNRGTTSVEAARNRVVGSARKPRSLVTCASFWTGRRCALGPTTTARRPARGEDPRHASGQRCGVRITLSCHPTPTFAVVSELPGKCPQPVCVLDAADARSMPQPTSASQARRTWFRRSTNAEPDRGHRRTVDLGRRPGLHRR